MEFPIYRKYFNNKSFFKINNNSEFEELIIIGKNYKLTTYHAKILPDRVMIEDMLNYEGNHWVDCTKEEYEERLSHCLSQLSKVE